MKIAVCSTSNERAVATIVRRMLGADVAARMRVFAGVRCGFDLLCKRARPRAQAPLKPAHVRIERVLCWVATRTP